MIKNDSMSSLYRTTSILIMITVWTAVFYICYFLFSIISFSNITAALAISGLLSALSTFGVLTVLIKKKISESYALMMLILSLSADIGINMIIPNSGTDTNPLLHYYAGINIALLGTALGGGILISGIIRKPSYLIPITAAAGLADIWSVSVGVTRKVVQSKTAMNFLLFSFPVAGKGIRPIIGVTDFIFAVLFLSLSHRFNFPIMRTQVAVAASFIVSISVAVFGGFGVPVLPLMGVFFIMGQYPHVKISDPQEKRDALRGILIIAAALTAVTLIKHIS